jgi:hypothetical protein
METLNNTKSNQNAQKFAFDVELLNQRKKLYGVKLKLHQFLSVIVSICFN